MTGRERADVHRPQDPPQHEIEVIVPNLNWRYSGVTATNRAIAPLLAGRARVGWLGVHRPEGVSRLGALDLLRSWRGTLRIWHARRNVEMIVGVVLKALGWPLALVFTSAGQRRHTWITRLLIGQMDAVIATSEAAASYLDRSSKVIPHGVDPALYCPSDGRAADLAQAGLPGRYAIGAFGRLRHQKGTDVFVAAMCRLLPKYPDFTAVVIGRADSEAFLGELKRQAAQAGLSDRIRFLGELPIAEVPPWFRRLAIYAFTSRNEGFGLTLLEAMASGVAVVAARAGAAEVVIADGETGVLVAPGDVEGLVAALEPLMRDPSQAEAMGRKGRARVTAEFSLAREAERILAVYGEVRTGAIVRRTAS
jgi:mannosyltransferase